METRESEDRIRAKKPGNGWHRSRRSKGGPCRSELQERNMSTTQMAQNRSTNLLKVRERAKRDPQVCFLSLAHLIDEEALRRAYGRIRKNAAVGVDGISKEQYGQDLEANLRSLHQRLRSKTWRHQPIRRVYIPKERGQARPIGIASTEDKIVENAIR